MQPLHRTRGTVFVLARLGLGTAWVQLGYGSGSVLLSFFYHSLEVNVKHRLATAATAAAGATEVNRHVPMLLAQNMWLVVVVLVVVVVVAVARCGFIIYVGKQTLVALEEVEHDLTTTASCVASATWTGIKGFSRLPKGVGKRARRGEYHVWQAFRNYTALPADQAVQTTGRRPSTCTRFAINFVAHSPN